MACTIRYWNGLLECTIISYFSLRIFINPLELILKEVKRGPSTSQVVAENAIVHKVSLFICTSSSPDRMIVRCIQSWPHFANSLNKSSTAVNWVVRLNLRKSHPEFGSILVLRNNSGSIFDPLKQFKTKSIVISVLNPMLVWEMSIEMI